MLSLKSQVQKSLLQEQILPVSNNARSVNVVQAKHIILCGEQLIQDRV
jgi:hypothetical protein